MEDEILRAQRDYWNRAFATDTAPHTEREHWLDQLVTRSDCALTGSALEIGCGRGYDTKYLHKAGCQVTCLDLSWHALRQVARVVPSVRLVNAALPAALPFASGSFDFVIAGLSLHYFRWHDTCMIVQEIRRVLTPNGTLIFRVNSTEDIAHGAGRGEEIEPNLYFHDGRYKRFFTERMCCELFDDTWRIQVLMPWVETRSKEVKPTWMGVVQRGE
jgi:SAM-dependent methyltransferase